MLRHKRDCVDPGVGLAVWSSSLGSACKGGVHVNLLSGFQKFYKFNQEKIAQVLNSTVSPRNVPMTEVLCS